MPSERPVDVVLRALEARGKKVRRRGDGADAQCPAHEDRRESLSVGEGSDGRALLHCHAGDSIEDICSALGLTPADLFAPKDNGHRKAEIVATYPYVDEHGKLLYEVVRFDPKDFRQRAADGSWSVKGVRKVPYRLPAVLDEAAAGGEIWVVEGEKDVAALERNEMVVATCNAGGAGKWDPAFAEYLTGASRVVVVADRDEPGRKHAAFVATTLKAEVDEVVVVEPAVGKDAADHLAAGLGVDEFVVAQEAAEAVPEPPDAPDDGLPIPIDWGEFWGYEAVGEEWLAEPLVPRGRQVALFSVAKVGKSLVSLDIATALATGRPCLGQPAKDPIPVVYVDMEMSKDDLMERLGEMGYDDESDLSRLHYYLLPDLPPLDSEEGGQALARIAEKHQAELVVVDTMARAVEGDEDHSDTYRSFYRHSGRALKAIGVALLRLDHAGKDAMRGQRGSSAKNDDVDIVWRLTADHNVLTLKATHRRVSWVSEEVTIERKDDPRLTHVWNDNAWPAGTLECAGDLELLDVPLDASYTTAIRPLRAHGKGRGKAVVLAAQKYRRQDSKLLKTVPTFSVPVSEGRSRNRSEADEEF